MNTTRYLLLALALALIVGGASALRDSFQGDADVTWGEYSDPNSYWTSLVEGWAEGNYVLEYSALAEAGPTAPWTDNIEYIAFTYNFTDQYSYWGIKLRDEEFTQLDYSGWYIPPHDGVPRRMEYIYDNEAGKFKSYVDGVFKQTTELDYKTLARYVSFFNSDPRHDWEHGFMDDVVIGSKTPTYIVSTVPESWYILNDLVTPRTQGLFNAYDNLVNEQFMYYRYSASTKALGQDLRMPDRIVTSHWDTGEVVNVSYLPDDKYTGTVKIDFKEMLIEPDKPYGIYQIKLYRSDNTLMDVYNFKYLPEMPGGYHISWDKHRYMSMDTAVINTSIEVLNSAKYIFKGQIIDMNGDTVYEWGINTENSEEEVEIDNWEEGTYIVALNLKDRESGQDFDIAYDVAEVTYKVGMAGTIYDVETGDTLNATDVITYQAGSWYNTTSAADGSYNLTDMVVDYPITVMAAKDGYDHHGFNFNPMLSKVYPIDIYMYPDNLTYTGDAAIAGMTIENLYHQAVPGANVTIYNTTWTGHVTASDSGYFIINNLAPNSTYKISGTSASYSPSEEYTVETTTGVTTQDVKLSGIYALTVNIRDGITHTPVMDKVTLGLTGEPGMDRSESTTSGDYTFTGLDAGMYTVTAAAEGYYGTTKNVFLDSNKTVILYLNEKTESSPFAYPPHNVKFTLRSAFGGYIPGAEVTAVGYETSMGSWAWLLNMLGINEEETPIQGTEMTGVTGSDGAINFMMIEAVKYRVNFYKEGEFNVTWEGYPKDEYYEVWTSPLGASDWYRTGYNPLDIITFAVTAVTSDADETQITVAYNDTLDNTTSATVNLDRRLANGTEINIASYNSGVASWNHTFNITGDHRDEDYLIRLYSDHGDLGNVTRKIGVHTKPGPTNLGLPEGLLLYFAMGIMLFTALFFGQTSVNAGVVVFSLEAWIFYWLGWLQDLGTDAVLVTTLTVITFIAVLYNIMHRSKRERYA